MADYIEMEIGKIKNKASRSGGINYVKRYKMQTAAIYLRVSTADQLEFSPEAQKKALFDYAMKNNIYISDEHIYIDEGISGKRADKRPEFMKMIATAKSKPKPFEMILVHKFDRFARSREDSIVYKTMLQREQNIKVISISEPLDDSPMSILLESMLEAMAEYYSLNLATEVKKGMTVKAERGEYQTSPPIGYDFDKINKKLVINETEAETVKLIFNEALAFMTTGRISKKLNMMGIKTKRGKMFDYMTVHYILNNPVYIGKARWTPTGRTRWDFNNPDTIVAKSNHEPIISETDFEAVNKIIASRKKIYPKYNTANKYFLSGLIKCGSCGSNLASACRKGLQCVNYNNHKCFISHYIKINKLEKILKQQIENDLNNENKNITVKVKEKNKKNNDSEKINNQIKKANQKLERATTAYLDGIYDIEYLKNIKEQIINEINELESQKQVKQASDEPNITKIDPSIFYIFDESRTSNERRHIAESIIESIVFDKSANVLMLYYK